MNAVVPHRFLFRYSFAVPQIAKLPSRGRRLLNLPDGCVIPGFGELFRMLSYQDIGPAAMLSRATAGLIGNMVVFSLPRSRGAVDLAKKELILPQIGHLVSEIRR